MRSPLIFNTYITPTNTQVEIWITPPSEYVREHQQQLLPGWKDEISYLVSVLQESHLSFKNSAPEVTAEKELLRTRFLRFGSQLIFALRDCQVESDLFDPRTGFSFLANSKHPLDDNAVVRTLLNYPLVPYHQCSLIIHPAWGDRVYPSTIATSADLSAIESCIKSACTTQNWQIL